MTDKLRFSPTFNENVKLSFPSEENIENDQSPIWNSWPVVVKVKYLTLAGKETKKLFT